MSNWQELDLGDKITHILQDVPEGTPGHHMGRPFMTAYQIAIELVRRFPDDRRRLGLPIGGAGTGQYNGLAQYSGQQLSTRIHSEELGHLEGGFLSNQDLQEISFRDGNETIWSSLTGTQFNVSIYRIRE